MRSVSSLWLAFGRRFSVGSGALVALVSLISEVPLHIASLRGALTVLALLAVTRMACRGLEWTQRMVERPAAVAVSDPAEKAKA